MRQAELAYGARAGLPAVAVGDPDLRAGTREEVLPTDAARCGTMMWQIAVEDSSTHCHQVLPPTRAEVSSEPTTGLARTAAAIGVAAAGSGAYARARMLAIAPSLMLSPNNSASRRARRSKPIAWVTVQMDDQGAQPGPERRAGFESLRYRQTYATARCAIRQPSDSVLCSSNLARRG